MDVNDAFSAYQDYVNVEDTALKEARRRRDLFKDAFEGRDDVEEVVASGSVRRGTHKDPINDVDTIIVFDADEHPDWNVDGDSAADALAHTGSLVNELLGATNGTVAHEVRLAKPRNHAVKCFLDDPEVSGAFTVDAMPALRVDGVLRIPEALSNKWIFADPEYLIAEIEKRHKDWNKFAGLVRMLKDWASNQDIKIKSLVMEILALEVLDKAPNRPAALKNFFVRAAYRVETLDPIEDPAGLCGPIQADLDMDTLANILRRDAALADEALTAVAENDILKAIGKWRDIFGDGFPKPPPPPSQPAKPDPSSPGLTPAAPALVQDPEPTRRPIKDTPQG